jgi:hypothetical protein
MASNDSLFPARPDRIAADDPPAAEPAESHPKPSRRVRATVGGIPIDSAILLPADHLHVESAWNQHIPFAFWLMQAHAPSIFVELGTFRGTSYFSFCQAVAALRLPTRCFAIDTWQGDSHTGFYDQSVFAEVQVCNERKYAGFSRLVRSSFDKALPHFLDGSIDLLHIDGLHTYEACRHDFECWLPKLSPRAVVLFHDTNVRERGFGVYRLWAELIERYPHFEFVHEHGLGVLGIGAALDGPVCELFAAADDVALSGAIRSAFWRLAGAARAEIDLNASSEERARLETLLSTTISESEIEVSRLNAELEHLRLALGEQERRADELIAQCAAAYNEKTELGAALNAARNEQTELAAAVAAARSDTAELNAALAAAHDRQAELAAALAGARSENAELGAALAAARDKQTDLAAALAEARGQNAKLGTALAAARGENDSLDAALAAARRAGADRQAALDEKTAELAAVRARGERTDAALAAARKELDAVARSASWRITRPLRRIAARARFARDIAGMAKRFRWIKRAGGGLQEHFLLRPKVRLIAASGLFDSDWYLEQYPDVRAARISPLVHYLRHGAAEGRDPNPLFDSDWYLDRYPDVRAAGVNPLLHYLRDGAREGRDPCESFSTRSYLANNPDIAAGGMNPLAHYRNSARGTKPPVAGPNAQEQAAATYIITNLSVSPPHRVAQSRTPLVVCVCHVFPWPPRAGNEYRIARMLEWLSARGHALLVVVAPIEEDDFAEQRRGELFAKYENAIVCYRDGRTLASINTRDLCFTTLQRRPVARVFHEATQTAAAELETPQHLEQHFCHEALIGILCELARQESNAIYYINYAFMTRFLQYIPRKVTSFVDTHDIFSHKVAKVRSFGLSDVTITPYEEQRMLRRADALVAIQSNDAEALRGLVPGKTVIHAGVDFPTIDPGPPSRSPNILLVAHLNPLNIKGLRDFLRFAWPRIKKTIDDAQFVVVGKIGEAITREERQVKIAGVVDSLAPYYRDARVVVNPAVAGTGLKIKTLEAIAYFRPVVAWPNGVEGVPLPMLGLCHVAKNWYEFAEKTIALLQDRAEGAELPIDRGVIARELSSDVVYNELSRWLSQLR